MALHHALNLKTPELTAPAPDSFLLNPKAVAEWVDALPMANIGETSRQVFKTIVEFNRIEIPSLSRIKSAELLREPIAYISNNLQKYFYDASFPLTAKNRKIAVLNRELYTELSLAYKNYISAVLSGHAGKVDRKLLIIAMHRALRYLSMMITQSLMIYDPVPADVWREIHQLYAFAESKGMQNQPVRERDDAGQASSIAQLYKQILLFSISSPYRMRQREIREIMHALDGWCRITRLEPVTNTTTSDCQFITRLASDSPPLHHTLVEPEEEEHCRMLDTHDLVASLQDALANTPDGAVVHEVQHSGAQFSRQLLEQLTETLSTAPKREFVRTKLNFELKVAVGINAINSLLSRGREQKVAPTELPTDSELAWLTNDLNGFQNEANGAGVTQLTLEGYDVSIEETIVASSIEDDGSVRPFTTSWQTGIPDQQIDTYACKTVNESAGGYCINWQGAQAPKVKIGEVIGIQSATNRNQFSIGISRWMKNIPGQGLLLGMQIIAPGSEAIDVHHLKGEEITAHVYKGLLLPEGKDSKQHATLILPTLPFRPGSLISIDDGRDEMKARLSSLLETSGAFSHFSFSYLGRLEKSGRKAEQDDQDF